MNPILTTDDEVLALAAKIKKQRVVDAIYAEANKKLGELENDLSTGTTKLRASTRLVFFTLGSSYHQDQQESVEIQIPMGAGKDFIRLVSNLISGKLK